MIGRLVHMINNIPLWFFVRKAHTILDIGCGVTSPIAYFVRADQYLDGLDIIPVKSLLHPYRHIFQEDVRSFIPPQKYDVITALDFIEHVPKKDGLDILTKMEHMAKRVVLVTPNGYIPQSPEPNNPFQEHLSGWTTEDFVSRGYRVFGMFGPKLLRRDTAVLRYRPTYVWGIIVWLLTPLFFWLPRYSFSLLAIYDAPSK